MPSDFAYNFVLILGIFLIGIGGLVAYSTFWVKKNILEKKVTTHTFAYDMNSPISFNMTCPSYSMAKLVEGHVRCLNPNTSVCDPDLSAGGTNFSNVNNISPSVNCSGNVCTANIMPPEIIGATCQNCTKKVVQGSYECVPK